MNLPRYTNVGVALICAVLLIGGSLYVTQLLGPAEPDSGTSITAITNSESGTAGWMGLVSDISDPDSTGNGRVGDATTVSDSIAQRIYELEQKIQNGELKQSEVNSVLETIAREHIIPLKPSDTYSMASLAIGVSSLEEYAGALSDAMATASLVEEYELATFARALRNKDFDGSPELDRAAALYRSIEKKLAKITIPEPLATSHLDLIKSVSFMARSTEHMAAWNGDGTEALIFIDAFLRSELQVEKALDALGGAMIKLGKTT
jgi:hypothetical protein